MHGIKSLVLIIAAFVASACSEMPSSTTTSIKKARDEQRKEAERNAMFEMNQDTYNFKDVGHTFPMEYGTVVKMREVRIMPTDYGVPYLPEKEVPTELTFHPGIEYTIITKGGKLFTVLQSKNAIDHSYRVGSHVLVQTGDRFLRVLPASNLPKTIQRPEGIILNENDMLSIQTPKNKRVQN